MCYTIIIRSDIAVSLLLSLSCLYAYNELKFNLFAFFCKMGIGILCVFICWVFLTEQQFFSWNQQQQFSSAEILFEITIISIHWVLVQYYDWYCRAACCYWTDNYKGPGPGISNKKTDLLTTALAVCSKWSSSCNNYFDAIDYYKEKKEQ